MKVNGSQKFRYNANRLLNARLILDRKPRFEYQTEAYRQLERHKRMTKPDLKPENNPKIGFFEQLQTFFRNMFTSKPKAKQIPKQKHIQRVTEYLSNTEVSYSGIALKMFHNLMERYDFSNQHDVSDLKFLIAFAKNRLACRDDSDSRYYFYDFIIRNGEPNDINDTLIYDLFPLGRVKFQEENFPIVKEILSKKPMARNWGDYGVELYSEALKHKNVNLLKILIEDLNWKHIEQDSGSYYRQPKFKNVAEMLNSGMKSSNKEIRALFNEDNIYKFLVQYEKISSNINWGEYPDFAHIMVTKSPSKRNGILDVISSTLLKKGDIRTLAKFPMSNWEKSRYEKGYLYERDYTAQIAHVTLLREENLEKKYNRFKTPQDILNAINDPICSNEFLRANPKIIETFAKIQTNDENKEIVSIITERLYQIFQPKDNEEMSDIAILSAKSGNKELLKFFNDKGVHYRQDIKEPVKNFEPEIQEIINMNKTYNPQIFDGIYSLGYVTKLKKMLEEDPLIDINVKNQDGRPLVLESCNENNLKLFKYLASLEDVDWNIKDDNGKGILSYLNFAWKIANPAFDNEAIKILRDISKEKLNNDYLQEFFRDFIRSYNPSDANRNFLKELLKFPNLDVNDKISGVPILIRSMNNLGLFKAIYTHPNTDRSVLFNYPLIKSGTLIVPEYIQNFIEKQKNLELVEEAKSIYETNGELTLDEIQQFVNYKNFDKIFTTKFNIVGENILHLLVDINVNEDNKKILGELKGILQTIGAKNVQKLSKLPDDFGVTPIDKAQEAENQIIIDLINKYTGNK